MNFSHTFASQFRADVAELVDALDLGSSAERRGGSSPFIRTEKDDCNDRLFSFIHTIEYFDLR